VTSRDRAVTFAQGFRQGIRIANCGQIGRKPTGNENFLNILTLSSDRFGQVRKKGTKTHKKWRTKWKTRAKLETGKWKLRSWKIFCDTEETVFDWGSQRVAGCDIEIAARNPSKGLHFSDATFTQLKVGC